MKKLIFLSVVLMVSCKDNKVDDKKEPAFVHGNTNKIEVEKINWTDTLIRGAITSTPRVIAIGADALAVGRRSDIKEPQTRQFFIGYSYNQRIYGNTIAYITGNLNYKELKRNIYNSEKHYWCGLKRTDIRKLIILSICPIANKNEADSMYNGFPQMKKCN